MGRFSFFILMVVSVCSIFSACSGKPYGQYRDDQMIGFVSSLDEAEQTVTFDVSEWMKRDEPGPAIEDWGAEYTAQVLPGTKLTNEAGAQLKWDDLKLGQKVEIKQPKDKDLANAPDELILLTMGNEEVLKRLGMLARAEGSYRTIIMYEQGTELPYDSDYFEREAPSVFQGGLGWVEYNPDYVLDLKKALDIGALPVFLVFDNEKLVVKTVRLENVVAFMDAIQEK
ncbi:hypothetical protein [Paenibacillus harenae]|uniref:hypothetical protein n=1 Tax=Paenibacillus harenae TaxID=306543 RepID=UPI0004151D18|nr:hypothetical protein [Paenibacillus harenae]